MATSMLWLSYVLNVPATQQSSSRDKGVLFNRELVTN